MPPPRRKFRDIYVLFELMESDLHGVVEANYDLTLEHLSIFLYQLLRSVRLIMILILTLRSVVSLLYWLFARFCLSL